MKKISTYSAQFKLIRNHVQPDYPNESDNYENFKKINRMVFRKK